MSNLIKFLESLGRDSTVSAESYKAAVAVLDVNDAQRSALAARDAGRLGESVTGKAQLSMVLFLDEDDSGWRDSGSEREMDDIAAGSAQLH